MNIMQYIISVLHLRTLTTRFLFADVGRLHLGFPAKFSEMACAWSKPTEHVLKHVS